MSVVPQLWAHTRTSVLRAACIWHWLLSEDGVTHTAAACAPRGPGRQIMSLFSLKQSYLSTAGSCPYGTPSLWQPWMPSVARIATLSAVQEDGVCWGLFQCLFPLQWDYLQPWCRVTFANTLYSSMLAIPGLLAFLQGSPPGFLGLPCWVPVLLLQFSPAAICCFVSLCEGGGEHLTSLFGYLVVLTNFLTNALRSSRTYIYLSFLSTCLWKLCRCSGFC